MIPALFKLRDILLHPPKNSRMGQSDAALGHHLDKVAGAEFKGQIPPDAQDDDLLVKMPPLEEILCRGRFRHPGRYGSAPVFSSVCTRTCIGVIAKEGGTLTGVHLVMVDRNDKYFGADARDVPSVISKLPASA